MTHICFAFFLFSFILCYTAAQSSNRLLVSFLFLSIRPSLIVRKVAPIIQYVTDSSDEEILQQNEERGIDQQRPNLRY